MVKFSKSSVTAFLKKNGFLILSSLGVGISFTGIFTCVGRKLEKKGESVKNITEFVIDYRKNDPVYAEKLKWALEDAVVEYMNDRNEKEYHSKIEYLASDDFAKYCIQNYGDRETVSKYNELIAVYDSISDSENLDNKIIAGQIETISGFAICLIGQVGDIIETKKRKNSENAVDDKEKS